MDPLLTLAELPEAERECALERYRLLRPFLEDGVPLSLIVPGAGVSLRTARRWVEHYRLHGVAGLCRKKRRDIGNGRTSPTLQEMTEGFALQTPRLPIASIHRKVVAVANALGERPPSYSSVYASIRSLDPGLLSLAHDGAKAYGNQFELVHRREASGPNAVWQADHTQLDVWVTDNDGQSSKPWLTIVLDDYSRAVAGYALFLGAPSAVQTALALRQAIWRKARTGWHVCGIPEVLYTDHGCDFTSRHLEQSAADMKMRLIFSTAGRPRGRGKIERFFSTLTQVFLTRLPGYAPCGSPRPRRCLTLQQLADAVETFIVDEYNVTPHGTTHQAPQARWQAGGFLPQMPDSLERLDLLLLTVATTRRVHPDGVRFMSNRYIDPTLAAYVGEEVLLRYDPRDMAEVRVFHKDRFLCRAVCQDLAGEVVALRDIKSARDRRRRELRQTIEDRRRTVDSLLDVRRWTPEEVEHSETPKRPQREAPLKRYRND